MTDKKKSIIYIVCAYAFFWITLALIGVYLTLMGEEVAVQDGIIFKIMADFTAWTPTFTLFILFKKLYPGSSIKEFYKNAFRERLNLLMLLLVTIIQLIIFFGAAGITAFANEVSFQSLLGLSFSSIIMGFVGSATSGAIGERSGWSGFLQPRMDKKYGVIKGSIIVGIVWGFWHTPLWFISVEYAGLALVQYIIMYMIFVISIAVIIGICHNRCRNLFVPIWIHFMANFSFSMFTGDMADFLNTFTWLAVIYVLVAIGYVVWYKKGNLYNRQGTS